MYINGDLIELALNDKFDAIVHGCNCFCSQKSGIAKLFVEKFSTDDPRLYPQESIDQIGSTKKLGTIEVAYAKFISPGIVEMQKYPSNGILTGFWVVNAYTQFYNSSRVPDDAFTLVEYKAVRDCFKAINKNFKGMSIGIPKIGAGRARGNWDIISEIIISECTDVSITVVNYNEP